MIFTFYSYKGGVGRSMAVANVAEQLVAHGLSVLLVDWDLEAPGLESYFPVNRDDVLDREGVIDLIHDYRRNLAKPPKANDSIDVPLAGIDDYVLALDDQPNPKLWLMPAGRRSPPYFARYAQRVQGFDWTDFYDNWEGELFFEWLRQRLLQRANVVIIDSRTGVTEMGGVCTYQLADTVVMFSAANNQNLEGTSSMIARFEDEQLASLRPDRPLQVIVVPARVDDRAEGTDLSAFKRNFKSRFDRLAPAGEDFWSLKIPHVPYYAFSERVAAREPGEGRAEALNAAYRSLVAAMAARSTPDSPIRRAFESSGVAGATGTAADASPERPNPALRAEHVYRAMQGEEQEVVLPMLTMLVSLSLGGSIVSFVTQTLPLSSLATDAVHFSVLAQLERAGVVALTSSEDDEHVALADASIVLEWTRFADWLEAHRARIAIRARIAASATLWDEKGRAALSLLSKERLPEAKELLNDPAVRLTPLQKTYVEASLKGQQKLRSVLLGATVALVMVVVGTVGYNRYAQNQERTATGMKWAELGQCLLGNAGGFPEHPGMRFRQIQLAASSQTSDAAWPFRCALHAREVSESVRSDRNRELARAAEELAKSLETDSNSVFVRATLVDRLWDAAKSADLSRIPESVTVPPPPSPAEPLTSDLLEAVRSSRVAEKVTRIMPAPCRGEVLGLLIADRWCELGKQNRCRSISLQEGREVVVAGTVEAGAWPLLYEEATRLVGVVTPAGGRTTLEYGAPLVAGSSVGHSGSEKATIASVAQNVLRIETSNTANTWKKDASIVLRPSDVAKGMDFVSAAMAWDTLLVVMQSSTRDAFLKLVSTGQFSPDEFTIFAARVTPGSKPRFKSLVKVRSGGEQATSLRMCGEKQRLVAAFGAASLLFQDGENWTIQDGGALSSAAGRLLMHCRENGVTIVGAERITRCTTQECTASPAFGRAALRLDINTPLWVAPTRYGGVVLWSREGESDVIRLKTLGARDEITGPEKILFDGAIRGNTVVEQSTLRSYTVWSTPDYAVVVLDTTSGVYLLRVNPDGTVAPLIVETE
jgi:MinD-like ATPase involved in chromosome partitioning or flagellar assembly